MQPPVFYHLAIDLLVILAAGLVAGVVCKRLGISVLVGYLVCGALLGGGGLGLVAAESHERGDLAEAGALLLLFSIGIEFSPEELVRLGRAFLLGGPVQMLFTGLPAMAACLALQVPWREATLIGAATALSSTVLVFKALEEWGQAATGHGRRAVGILLFQDAALVPLILLLPLLTGSEPRPDAWAWVMLVAHSAIFILAVPLLRIAVIRWGVPVLAGLRSTELVVLFTLTVLGGAVAGAYALGLPPALGAFAAGLILSGNRLSGQIDAIILPYRETFAAVFFISLGALMRLGEATQRPWTTLLAVGLVVAGKTLGAAAALRIVGLRGQGALGMGLGLGQLGEFSFILLSDGFRDGVLSAANYDRMLLIGVASLIVTPQLLKHGLRWATQAAGTTESPRPPDLPLDPAQSAVVIGLGPIGGQVASQLEMAGLDVCLIDLSPVNLHRFAQQGFRTVAGDATQPEVLRIAGAHQCRMAVVTVPDDTAARHIVEAIRRVNRSGTIVVRCRYQLNRAAIKRAGANAVVTEEVETSAALLRLLDNAAPSA